MLIKILGILDLFVVIGIILMHFNIDWWKVPIIITIYFGCKLGMFYSDFATWVDFFIGLYIWLIFIGFTTIFDYVIIFYLLTKAVFSLF